VFDALLALIVAAMWQCSQPQYVVLFDLTLSLDTLTPITRIHDRVRT
jgi:hypothetical protein